jgi:hypothetical protein
MRWKPSRFGTTCALATRMCRGITVIPAALGRWKKMDSVTSRRRPATTSSTRAGDRLKIYIFSKFTWICHALFASSSSSLWEFLQNLRLHVAIDQESMNLKIAVCFSPCWDHITFFRCFRFSNLLILQFDKIYVNLQIAVLCFCPNWDNHCSKSSLSRLFSPNSSSMSDKMHIINLLHLEIIK